MIDMGYFATVQFVQVMVNHDDGDKVQVDFIVDIWYMRLIGLCTRLMYLSQLCIILQQDCSFLGWQVSSFLN